MNEGEDERLRKVRDFRQREGVRLQGMQGAGQGLVWLMGLGELAAHECLREVFT